MQASEASSEQMLSDMVAGFDSLLENVDALRARNAELQQLLDGLRKKDLATPAPTEDGKTRSRSRSRRQELDFVCNNTLPLDSRAVRKAREVSKLWHAARKPEPEASPSIELPEGHPQINEQDFTTPGATPGRLGCPFAAMMAEKNKPRSHKAFTARSAVKEDPIAAEFHPDALSSPPPSASGSAAKCPIRFLDQHKPEEVAQYFENHKHEIPRSHEVCIKRYQTNEQSIRQLDAKYGSLVNMIQGLGKKHKSMLPEDGSEEELGHNDDSQVMSDRDAAKIQRWAGNVLSEPTTGAPLAQQPEKEPNENSAGTEQRTPRFERDLRDVRLGESPSRPWGIQVPAAVEDQVDQMSRSARMADSSVKVDALPPENLAAPAQKEPDPASTKVRRPAGSSPSTGSSMVFNGPVFFGYSADDMARLLQNVPELRSSSRQPA